MRYYLIIVHTNFREIYVLYTLCLIKNFSILNSSEHALLKSLMKFRCIKYMQVNEFDHAVNLSRVKVVRVKSCLKRKK